MGGAGRRPAGPADEASGRDCAARVSSYLVGRATGRRAHLVLVPRGSIPGEHVAGSRDGPRTAPHPRRKIMSSTSATADSGRKLKGLAGLQRLGRSLMLPIAALPAAALLPVSYTHLRAHETDSYL